jgi:rod shape-determining protein MreD
VSPRIAVFGLIIFVTLLLQAVVAPIISVAGWPPDIVLATVVAVAVVEGAATGARYGFVAGLGADLLSGGPHLVGLIALVMLLVGEGVGRVRPYLGGTQQAASLALGAAAGVVAFGLFGAMSLLLDIGRFTLPFLLEGALANALWAAIAAPVMTVPIRAVARRFSRGEPPGTGPLVAGRGW